ncbi:hypothetical protein [Alkalicoccobacillus gibsonii]|uniref:hypothetical protein n=1 Tax=Alkalicoccobacillus gibsonii TaxID=79881 RepID=UPI003518AAD6
MIELYHDLTYKLFESVGVLNTYRIHGLILFFTGFLSSAFLCAIAFAKTFKEVETRSDIPKVSFLVAGCDDNQEYYASKPKNIGEALQTTILHTFYSMKLMGKKNISFTKTKKQKATLVAYFVVGFLLFAFGIWFSLSFVIEPMN